MSISTFRCIALIPIALWLISLVVPAVGGDNDVGMGWQVLLIGWLGILNAQFGWFANIAFVWSIPIIMNVWQPSSRAQVILSLSLVIPALQTLFWTEIHTHEGNSPVIVLVGYYFWLAAMLSQVVFLNAAKRSSGE
jgi:hypothetical protein